jgi:hypothetical protein
VPPIRASSGQVACPVTGRPARPRESTGAACPRR